MSCRSAPKYAIRVSPGRKLSPGQLVTELQDTGLEAEPSNVLPDDFLVVNGLQHLIRQGFLERGDCQVHVRPSIRPSAFCLSVCPCVRLLSVCLSVCLPVCLPACLPACLPGCLAVCTLSVSLSDCKFVYLPAYLLACLACLSAAPLGHSWSRLTESFCPCSMLSKWYESVGEV